MLCHTCKEEKLEREFYKRTLTGKFQSRCIDCFKKYHKEWYLKNKELVKARTRKSTARYRKEAKKLVLDYLLKHPCIDCGETDPIVLEFDHREQSKKEYGISVIVRLGYSLETITQEISKCDVRCCNCHRRKTFKQLNWKK